MEKVGNIKLGHKLGSKKLNFKPHLGEEELEKEMEIEYPLYTLHDSLITIGGKVVSYEMLYAIVAKRFHECL